MVQHQRRRCMPEVMKTELLASQAIEHQHFDGMWWDMTIHHQVLDTTSHCEALARASDSQDMGMSSHRVVHDS